jgi:hypothetical protein
MVQSLPTIIPIGYAILLEEKELALLSVLTQSILAIMEESMEEMEL